MNLIAEIGRAGGVMRTRTLQDAGHSRHHISRLCAAGALTRPRRGWVAIPEAPASCVWAARHGVVLTCVTQAAALGLWTRETPARPHVAAPAHAGHAHVASGHCHWSRPLLPRHPDALVDPIENVLGLVATCRPFEEALAVWESALNRGLVTTEAMGGYTLGPAARRILAEATIWSDSGLETFVVPRLRWMRLPLRRQIWIGGHHVDLLIGDRLVLQIDGGTHVGAQREADIAHDAQLRLMGYHVIRVGYRQVVHAWHEVQDLLMRAIGQRLHLAR